MINCLWPDCTDAYRLSAISTITRFEDFFDTQSAQKYLQQFQDRLKNDEEQA